MPGTGTTEQKPGQKKQASGRAEGDNVGIGSGSGLPVPTQTAADIHLV